MAGPIVFDRRLLRMRQRRARAQGPATSLIEHVAAELAERLAAVLRTFDVAVDLGTPTDALRRALAAGGKIATLIAAGTRLRETASVVVTRAFACVAASVPRLAIASAVFVSDEISSRPPATASGSPLLPGT